MSSATNDLLEAFEGHDTHAVSQALYAGADVCKELYGKTPILWLLEQYTRSDRLSDCLQLLLDHGASLPDPLLLPVLLNDSETIQDLANADSRYVTHRTSLVSAFTSLSGVTLLHVAAEYGNIDAARALIAAGADVNARADVDSDGLNGHTPIFHSVNSNDNRSEPIMQLLLDAGAQTDIQLAGIHWGKGFEWETIFFDVTPISYAQIGLMPQVHRCESDIYKNIQTLLRAAKRSVPALNNIPNRYLRS